MEYHIERALDWDEYRAAWSDLMKDYYWFKQDPVFDWNKHEELREMQETFSAPDYGYYYAKRNSDSKVVGVLGVSSRNAHMTIRRWEPTVADPRRDGDIADSLLEYITSTAVETGKSSLNVTVKYPVGTKWAAWHLSLYQKHGFSVLLQPQAGLLMKLPSRPFVLPLVADVSVTNCDGFSDAEIAGLVVACFTSTTEDQRIHRGHASVTDYPTALQAIKRLGSEKLVHSPDQWQVANADGRPIAVVGSLISPNHTGPQVGVLGPVGILPAYRRRGITSLLILSVLNALLETGCKFAVVGTPEHNYPAIRMYEKLGFNDHERLIRLRRSLKSELVG